VGTPSPTTTGILLRQTTTATMLLTGRRSCVLACKMHACSGFTVLLLLLLLLLLSSSRKMTAMPQLPQLLLVRQPCLQ
jgi:hypothetical protein